MTRNKKSLEDFPDAQVGDLVLFVDNAERYSRLFRIARRRFQDSFRAAWGCTLNSLDWDLSGEEPEDGPVTLPDVKRIEGQYLYCRNDTADYVYVGDKAAIAAGLREHDRFRGYAAFLEDSPEEGRD